MKYVDEITVEVSIDYESLREILYLSNFNIVEEYDVKDIYMLDKKTLGINEPAQLLKNCVLIRDIKYKTENFKCITYKNKEYNDKKEIVKHSKIDCYIKSVSDAIELFEALNYERLIDIYDHIIVFSNGYDELSVQIVNNKHIYIEVESKCSYIDKKYCSYDEMKNVIKKYNIPIKNEEYFAKKAEIELMEVFNLRSESYE